MSVNYRVLRLMAVGEATAAGEEWEFLRLGPVVDPDGALAVDITADLARAIVAGINAQVAAGLDIPIDFAHESERRDGDGSHATLGVVTGARFDAATGRGYVTKRLNALGAGRLSADRGEDGRGVSLRTSPALRLSPLAHPSEPGKVIAEAWMSSLAVTDRPRQNGLAAISLSANAPPGAMLARYEGVDGSAEAHRAALTVAVVAALQARGMLPEDGYGWACLADWNTDAAVVEVYPEGGPCVLYRLPYTEAGDTLTIGAPEVVERVTTYEPKAAATVAVQMSRPAGAHAGGTLMDAEPQSTQAPGAAAPAPDMVTLAQVTGERDALRLARDEAKAEAAALKVELAQVKAGASTLDRTVETLSASVAELKSRDEERAKAEAAATFDAGWKACLSRGAVVSADREKWEADYTASPAVVLACLSRLAPGAVGIRLGAPAGAAGEAADAETGGIVTEADKHRASVQLGARVQAIAAEKGVAPKVALRLCREGTTGNAEDKRLYEIAYTIAKGA